MRYGRKLTGMLIRSSRLRRACVLAPLLLLGSAVATGAGTVPLVRNGKSQYAIVIAFDASPSERHGAAELQKFIEEMSGARLPITAEPQRLMVLVGRSVALDKLEPAIPFADLGPEGFALKTKGRQIIIAGGRQRGTMYGVYEFLEKLGCRWFTADVSRIPKMSSIAVPALDEIQKPSFEAREPFFGETRDPDWAARNKVNGQSMRLDAGRGGKIVRYPGGHSFSLLVPPEKYFKDHPEYFSLVGGKRRIDPYMSQLCLTNPDVLRIGIESVERWIAEHPEATNISVSQNDGDGWCECDNCRRVEEEEGGAHSAPVLRFVNALAAAIAKKHPDKLIDTFAYGYTMQPPLKTRPDKNVRIRVCPSAACFGHPFETCEYDQEIMRDLKGWSSMTGQLYVWHYNTNFLHYLLPFPDFDELAADIPMYHRNGVVGLFMEGSTDPEGGAENAELRSYVMARLMWNVNADVSRAVDEFHEAYYGRAARPMRAYFDLLQSQVRQRPGAPAHHLWIGDPPSAPYLGGDFLAKATDLFRQAEAAAENETVRRHVRKARMSIDYLRLSRTKRFIVEGDSYQPANLASVKDAWNALVATARGFGISHFSENSTLTEEDRFFQELVRPYKVATIENERLRVHVVADLGGRVTHIIDKRTGRNLILEPQSMGTRSKIYPDMGGLTVALYTDPVVYTSYPFGKWQVDRRQRGWLSLSAVAASGVRIRRTLRLDGGFLRTETVVENASGEPLEGALESRWEVDPDGLEAASVTFNKRAGGEARRRFHDAYTAGESYSGPELPDREWRVASAAGGPAIVNRFTNAEVVRCRLDWETINEGWIGMAVTTARRELRPGESMTLQADYGIE